jgi:hypothetical protein
VRWASRREKSSKEFTSFSRRSLLRYAICSESRTDGSSSRIGRGEGLLELTAYQGQRRAKFVAHVREKIRLGAIDRGQRIGAAPLRFPGGHSRQPRGDLRRDEIQEVRIVVIETAQRV